MNCEYINYIDFAADIDRDAGTLRMYYGGRGCAADEIRLTLRMPDGTEAAAPSFAEAEVIRPGSGTLNHSVLILRWKGGESLTIRVYRDAITAEAAGFGDGAVPVFAGNLHWGDAEDCFAVCLGRSDDEKDLRSALGPAVSIIDDALFDRKTDEALTVEGSISRRIGFSWERNGYNFRVEGVLKLGYQGGIFAQKFRVRYHAINKKNTFPKPPAGWMTWYAVKFGAGEKAVLENAALQKELLADYGADTVWVDWEWYHSNLKGEHVSDDIGYMSPDPVRYPHGLRHVSDEIRAMGFVPALWVGPTNEPDETETVKKYRDSVHLVKPSWCGRYFFDITDERVRDELIPAAFAKVKEWGYDALKWDCLPITLAYSDACRHTLKHPEISSYEAIRAVCKKARETVGEDFYMLSCSGTDRVMMLAAEDFDGARIGGDIFTWQEYIRDFVERILRFYPFHNTLLYCDPDNLVIREEFNNLDQARSRAAAVSLLGLPITLGDDLRELPMERVDIIRRALPTLDAHPKDIREGMHDGRRFLINLAVSRPFETWNIASVTNLLEEEAQITVSLHDDLKLDDGEYLIYDYWNDSYLGIFTESITVSLPAMATAVLSVRRKTAHPQILSTSRHITQGAVELKNAAWDDSSCTLTVTADTVKGDPYRIRVYVPEGYVPVSGEVSDGVLTVEPETDKGGEITCVIAFRRI